MKHFASVLLLIFFSSIFFKAQAQQQHFIYIESADKQPFAVVLNGKVYSSSDYGYVIVPKLTDGDYNFTVSFPMNKYPDQNFKCVINKKDLGFKLENSTDKGWALQNMQTQKVLAINNTASADNAFSNMLSDVVSDSNLANKNLPVNNTKPDTTATSKNIDTSAIAATTNIDTTSVAAATTIDTSNLTTAQSGTNIGSVNDSAAQLQKISETKLDTGTNMVFVDKTAADTIKVFVPNDSANNTGVANSVNDSLINQQKTTASNTPAQTDSNVQKTDTTTTALNQSPSQTTDTATHAVSNPFYNSTTNQNSNTNTVAPTNTNAML